MRLILIIVPSALALLLLFNSQYDTKRESDLAFAAVADLPDSEGTCSGAGTAK